MAKTIQDVWKSKASALLKSHLVRRRLGHRELAEMLAKMDVFETENSISKKLVSGSFSLAFYLQCMQAMDVKTVDISDL